MVAPKRNGIKDTMRESLITTQIGSSDICQVCIFLILHLMVRYTMDHVTKVIESSINDAFHILQRRLLIHFQLQGLHFLLLLPCFD